MRSILCILTFAILLFPPSLSKAQETRVALVADLAIDGNTDGSWGGRSVSHTSFQRDPWWEVDLGSVQPVHRIRIFNRTDGDLENRLHRFRVSLLSIATLVALSRVFVGVHYLFDVLAGAVAGGCAALMVIAAFTYFERRVLPQPPGNDHNEHK